MSQYSAPGVYVEEVERGAKPIEGVGTSTAAFLGETERGPEQPQLLTSYADYQRLYGGVVENTYLAQAVNGFFQNGGSRCYVGRVTASTTTATANLSPHAPESNTVGPATDTLDFGRTPLTTERTRSVVLEHRGQKGDATLTIDELNVTGQHSGKFDVVAWTNADDSIELDPGERAAVGVTFTPGSSNTGSRSATLKIVLGGPNASAGTTEDLSLAGEAVGNTDGTLGTSTGRVDFGTFAVGEERTETVTITNLGSTDVTLNGQTDLSSTVFSVDADYGSSAETVPGGESTELSVTVDPTDAGPKSATLEVDYGTNNSLTFDLAATVTESVIRVATVGPGEWGKRVSVTVADGSLYEPGENQLFAVTVRYWGSTAAARTAADVYADPAQPDDDAPTPDRVETYDNLSVEAASSDYYEKQLDGSSMLLEVLAEHSESGQRPANGTYWLDEQFPATPPAVEVDHFEGDATVNPEDRTGLAGLAQVDEVAIVCIPDEHGYGAPYELADKLVGHCLDQGDRFAVLQSEQQPGRPGSIQPSVRSDYAAFYYPWLTIAHPETGRDQVVPPGGHIAGIYARSDQQHGVHKAPANETVRGIRELQRNISKGDQEILNPRGVNCIRTFRGRGTRVWGARTTSSDPAWKYVNVRRLFLYVEESIDEGTQWVVFENNDEKLWARVRQTIRNFLTTVWENGALMGTTPEEAFYVKCDRSTMTQNDIDNGRLICEIGIAPVKPAEFVIFRISQTTAGGE